MPCAPYLRPVRWGDDEGGAFGAEAPFPSLGDVLYLSVYPCLAVGLLMMVRLRTPGRDWTSLLDSMMVAAAVATVSWVFIMSPHLARHAE